MASSELVQLATAMYPDYTTVWVRDHVEVFDWAGRFCFSADTEQEARDELAQFA